MCEVITGLSIYRYKSFHPTVAHPIHFEANTPPRPVFLYGINGAGKSAIGEVIQGLAGKEAEFSHCALQTSNNADYRILVYNQRFVDKVIRTAEGVPGIFTIGVQDAATQTEIEEKQAETERLEAQSAALDAKIQQTIDAGKAVRDIAITGAWKAHSDYDQGPFRDLMKGFHSDRQKFFEELDTYTVADDVELDNLDRLMQRLADANSTESSQPKISLDLAGLAIVEADAIWGDVIAVSATSRLAPLIEKWGNSDWVGQGRKFAHDPECPFCQQHLPAGFAEDLALLLDGDRQSKLDRVQSLSDTYAQRVAEIEVAAKTMLEQAFSKEEPGLEQAWDLFHAQIKANAASMLSKIEKPGEIVVLEASNAEGLTKAIATVNERVTQFNTRVADRVAERERIKTMFWQVMRRERAPVYDTYKAGKDPLAEVLKKDREDKAEVSRALTAVAARLRELRRVQSGVAASVDKINSRLARMGIASYSIARKAGEGNLYCLARPGQAEGDMKSLSEGEKTLISFLYYLECLGGSDTAEAGAVDLGRTIAVIDDPISSLSHNFVFDIASIIYGELIKPEDGIPRPRQVIVLTHNLFFLHEVLRQTIGGSDLAKASKKCQLLRVVKPEHTKVVPMKAAELMNDYQALWQVLRDARDSNVPAIMVPNAMRCILEHFFWFTHQEDKFKEALKKVGDEDATFAPLARYLDRGSHKDGINITVMDFNQYDLNYYFTKFQAVFVAAGFGDHYLANMGAAEDSSAA
ncbi:TPA: AAA family ATPase [Stenotrophomonas maltophilia]|nr:AAA family ATPase [Stenotrophomonas maltophilia]